MRNNKEQVLHNNVLNKLIDNGWVYNDMKKIDNLNRNFINHVNSRNKVKIAKVLNGERDYLSTKEIERLLNIVNSPSSISEYAKLFLGDDFPLKLDNNKMVYINLFDKVSWCSNNFEVISELTNNQTDLKNNRYDLLLLINGIPLANIEFKQSNVSINNAFNQTNRYHYQLKGLLKYIQIYIISNENNTFYYANNKNFNRKFAFTWVDENNNRVENIFDFCETFLDKCNFSEYISRYIINKQEKNTLMALRGYQVHAVKKILNHVKQSSKNGYIWHTTGSGKTITSFKAAQILRRDSDVDKVIFLVDRKDLDNQTIKEYNSFLHDVNKLKNVDSSRTLYKQLKSSGDNLIISTIQKMDNVLKNKNKYDLLELKNQRIVFIVDECHRSTFGLMYQRVNDFFTNAQYIGFTGTPIFASDDQKDGDLVTNDVFDVCLHKYLIKNAIEDKSVLPFQVEYHEPVQEIANVSEYLNSSQYIEYVVDEILSVHTKKTNKNMYFGLATFASINALIKAYKLLALKQNEMQENNPNYEKLKVSATFSLQADENESKYENQLMMDQIIKDFNSYTNSNETIKEVSKFNERLQNLIKGETEIQINLVLVVDQLLTGFDAKKLNTIYLAHYLRKANLIQAISRTNRVFDTTKNHGNVISYVPNLKQEVDNAVKIYSNSNNAQAFITRDYSSLLDEGRDLLSNLNNLHISYEDAYNEPVNNVGIINAYKDTVNKLQNVYQEIRTYKKFHSNDLGKDYQDNQFSVDSMKGYISNAIELQNKWKEWVDSSDDLISEPEITPDSVDIPMRWVERVNIDTSYILKLIAADQDSKNEDSLQSNVQKLKDIINNNSDFKYTKLPNYIDNINMNKNIYEELSDRENENLQYIISEYNINYNEVESELNKIKIKSDYDVSHRNSNIKEALQKNYGFKQRREEKKNINVYFKTINAIRKLLETR